MELRKDYILDRWAILSSGRGKRPKEFKKKEKVKPAKTDYFAPGNEDKTPPEIGRLGAGGKKWKMRWFANKFPAVDEHGSYEIKTDNKYFTYASAYGRHEIVVETPSKVKQLWDLDVKDVKDLLKVYAGRIKELGSVPGIEYVHVFKNHGPEAGTSIFHSHSQIVGYNKIPKDVLNEIEASGRYDSCPYCEIVQAERNSYRRCFENDDFLAFCPYAPRFNFEIWIFPKKHLRSMTDLGPEEFNSLAEIMIKIMSKLKELNASYNYYLHHAPKGKDLHFHIEICPRIAIWGGFELGSGDIINSVPPEDAAAFYRNETQA